jgi:hypothetical protein
MAIRSTIAAASNGSQTLPLPMEQNLARARGPRQIRRYLIFCAGKLDCACAVNGRLTRYLLHVPWNRPRRYDFRSANGEFMSLTDEAKFIYLG